MAKDSPEGGGAMWAGTHCSVGGGGTFAFALPGSLLPSFIPESHNPILRSLSEAMSPSVKVPHSCPG